MGSINQVTVAFQAALTLHRGMLATTIRPESVLHATMRIKESQDRFSLSLLAIYVAFTCNLTFVQNGAGEWRPRACGSGTEEGIHANG